MENSNAYEKPVTLKIPVYGIFLRGCPYAELLLRRTEQRKTEKAGWVEYESDRGDFCDYGCGFLCDDKAAGIRICQNG